MFVKNLGIDQFNKIFSFIYCSLFAYFYLPT